MHLQIFADNQGVIGSWKKRASRSEAQNRVLALTLHILIKKRSFLTLKYVLSEENPADGPSRGAALEGYELRKLGKFPKSLVHTMYRPRVR